MFFTLLPCIDLFTAIAAIPLHRKIHEIRSCALVNENHFERVMSLRNGSLLPTTQCACADFVDFATQRNGGGREKDLLVVIST
jgi:hypothetical protein